MQFQSTFNELLKKVEPAFHKVSFLSPETVSYTHLDVYKRQTLANPSTFKNT
ncbi:hypothetical protein A5806_002662, partial [Enterococcus faecium]